MTEAKYESADAADPGSARDLLAKFDKIENPNSPGRKPKAPKQKQVAKDIYKPQTLGETPEEGKGVSSNPFLQIDKEVKKEVKKAKEESSPGGVYMSRAGDSAKATGLAIKSWSTKLFKALKENADAVTSLPVCVQIREKTSSKENVNVSKPLPVSPMPGGASPSRAPGGASSPGSRAPPASPMPAAA